MQVSSAEFEGAIEGDIVWADPKLRVGWHGNDPIAPTLLSQGYWEDQFQRSAPDSWVHTVRYTWDAGTEGWVGEGSTTVAMDGGQLKATNTLGAGIGSLRFNDNQGVRNLSASGPTLRVWASLPPGTPGTDWLARIEVQDASFVWHGGPDTYIVPGAGPLELRYTPPPELLANMRSFGVQFLATNVNATVNAFVNDFTQGWLEPDAAYWESPTPTLIDVAPGAATIAVNVTDSSRGVHYEAKDPAGSYFLTDWEVFTVVSANVLPAGADYMFMLAFLSSGVDQLHLYVWVDDATNRVAYQMWRIHSTGSDPFMGYTYVPAVTYTANKKMAIRWAQAGGQSLVKVWDYDNDEEPQEWLSIATDKRAVFTGRPSLRGYLSLGNTNGTVVFTYHQFALKDMRWIGDLTPQMGSEYSVAHSMDDGMPSAVSSSLVGEPQAAMTSELGGRLLRGEELDARQYFSPFNERSLVYGYPRDLAPVHLEHGLVTVNGSEMVRLFTGQMTNVAIRGRDAELQAISATRLKLARGVRPPIVNGPQQGAEVTWLANYLLWACGVYVAPPVDLSTCQIYIPGAGSMRPYLPFSEGSTEYASVMYGNSTFVRPTFRDGPFLRAINSRVDRMSGAHITYSGIGFRHREDNFGNHYLVESSPRARMEFWLYGTTADPEIDGAWTPPTVGDSLAYFWLPNGATGRMQLGVDANRQVYWRENLASRVVLTGLTLPADNAWHALGMYYDYNANTVRVHLDGEERVYTPSPALDPTQLDEVDDEFRQPEFWSAIPYAEIRLHTGSASQIDPSVVGWDAKLTRVAGAQVAFEDWEDTTYNVTWSGGWARANDQAFAGTWSLKSAAILDYGFSGFLLTLPGGIGEVRFQVRLSTEAADDVMRVWSANFYHTFSSVASNSLGAADIGPSYGLFGTASDYSASGGLGRMAMNTTATERMAWVDTGSNDGEIQADVNFGVASATGAPIRIRLRGRGTGADTNNNYYAQLELDTSGNVRLGINKRINSVAEAVVSNVLLGSNGSGANWRVRFAWTGTQLRATAFNISTPGVPVTISGKTEGLTVGERVYFGGERVGGNTVVTTITFDNVMINGITLYGGSGPINAWQEVALKVPAGVTQLLFRYEKDQTSTGGSDAVWIDNLELRAAPTITSSFVPSAVMRGIEMELEAVVQDSPREAWGWLAEICQSTLTIMRADEIDRMLVLPPRYFVEPDQLVVDDTLTTEWNAQDPDITLDPSKIRNSVQVDFREHTVDTAFTNVLEYKTVITIPRGVHRVEFTLDIPTVEIVENLTPQYWDVGPPTVPSNTSAVYVNTLPDGTGTRLNTDDFTATVVEWTAQTAVVEFNNNSGADAYLVHDLQDDTPYLAIAGKGVHVQDASASVQAVQSGRPERTVTVQAPTIQTRAEARALAAALLVWTSRPRAEVSLKALGDPRRQPGDLYELQDPEGTKVKGKWRPLSITHTRRGSEYTQDIALREVLPVALWDDNSAGWDEGVWS